MLTGHGSIDTAIESIRMGAFDYVAKPCPLDELEIRIQRALERQTLQRRASLLERGLTPPDPRGWFVGESPEFQGLLRLVERVAPSDATVLVTGETGSGKEMVARLIHARSTRAERPFVVVECAALQEELLQSELFGHERGAFTGADRAKPGLFEVAHGGTIFLDEIGEVSQATQVKLLRVLDTSTFRHVGGTTRDPRGRPRARRHQPRPRGDGPPGAVPRGPLLPPEHDHRRAPRAPRPPAGHRPAGRPLRRRAQRPVRIDQAPRRRRARAPAPPRLAGQRPRAAARHRARDRRLRRRGDPARAPAGRARRRAGVRGGVRPAAPGCPPSPSWSGSTSSASSAPWTDTAARPPACSASASGTSTASCATTSWKAEAGLQGGPGLRPGLSGTGQRPVPPAPEKIRPTVRFPTSVNQPEPRFVASNVWTRKQKPGRIGRAVQPKRRRLS